MLRDSNYTEDALDAVPDLTDYSSEDPSSVGFPLSYKYGSADLWDKVARLACEYGYMTTIPRTAARVASNGEVFTPIPLVIELLSSEPLDSFAPSKTVLDPACGDGQFLIVAKAIKMIEFGMSEEEALSEIYGVDIMRDNVELCKERLGGGTIIMGNTLKPTERLPEQTDDEFNKMRELFG